MGQAAANEPTMEEILASIRQIIAEEEHHSEQQEKAGLEVVDDLATLEVPEFEPDHDLDQGATQDHNFEISPLSFLDTAGQGDDEMAHQNYQAPARQASDDARTDSYREVDLDDDMIERRAMAGPGKSELEARRDANRRDDEDRAPPVNKRAPTEAEADRFRGALMSPNTNEAVHASFERLKASFGENMEEKTEKMLRPMLQEWLDENLPTLVERLVREEIERVARGE